MNDNMNNEMNAEIVELLEGLINVNPIAITQNGEHLTIMRIDRKTEAVEFLSNGDTLLQALQNVKKAGK